MTEGLVITDHVTEYGRKFRESVEAMKGNPYVKAGILQEDFQALNDPGGKGKSTVGDAAVNTEFGTKKAPARSWLRSTADEKRHHWDEFMASRMADVIDLKLSPAQALGLMGLRMVSDIQKKIRSNVPPPNAPSTIMRKLGKLSGATKTRLRSAAKFAGGMQSITDSGAVKTLIDTGQMLQSVNYAVVDGGVEKAGSKKK